MAEDVSQVDANAPVQPSPAQSAPAGSGQPASQPQTPPPVSDRAKNLYNQLIQNGATQDDLGDLKTFTTAIQDPNKTLKVWDHLTTDLGVSPDDLGGKQHFMAVFQPAPTKLTAPITGTNSGQSFSQMSGGVPMSPVASDQLKGQITQQATQQAQAVSDKIKQIYTSLPPTQQAQWNKDMALPSDNDKLSAPTQAQLNHEWFMNSPGGRIVGTIGTVASDVTHSIVDMGKMATLMIGHVGIAGMGPGLSIQKDQAQAELDKTVGNDGAFDAADKAANLGLSQNDIDKAHGIPVLGQAIQLAPIVATEGAGELAELPSLSKSLFFLQFGGAGINTVNDIEKSGVKVDPLVKNLYPYLTGAVGSLFMGNVGETLAGKLPAEAGGKLASAIAADVFMKSAQQDLGADGVSKLLAGTTQTYLEKLEQGTLNIANSYKENIINLAKFDAGNYMAKVATGQAAAATGGKDPFQDNLGDLTNNLYNTITKTAPMFTGLGMVGSKDLYTMAAPHTGFRNDITSSLIADPSEDNVNNLKQQLTDYGKSQSWSDDQLQGTLGTVDKIATAAKAIPNNVNAKAKDKMVSLLVGRQELKDQYDTYQQQNGNPDPAMQDVKTPEQQTYSNKIDQANDKLKATVMGGADAKVEYKDNESGNPVKIFPDGSSEKITPSRMAMEQNESSAQKTSMFKVKNAPFFNFASSIGATEDDGKSLTTKNSSAVNISIVPSSLDKKHVYITNLEVPEDTRGLGLAKDKLDDITKKADKQNITLGVHLVDDEGYDKPRLTKLYSNFGFKSQGDEYMERKPNDKENEKSNEVIESDQPEETSSNAGDDEKVLPGNSAEASSEGGSANVEANAETGIKNDVKSPDSTEETTSQPVEAENGGSTNVNGQGSEVSSESSTNGNGSEGSGSGRSESDGILNEQPIPESELSQLKNQYKDTATKLEKVRKSIELHNSGEKELDEPALQAKKIQRDKFSRQLTDIEAKISSANDAYYAKVGKPVSDPISAVGVGKMASIDAKIAEVYDQMIPLRLNSESLYSTKPGQDVVWDVRSHEEILDLINRAVEKGNIDKQGGEVVKNLIESNPKLFKSISVFIGGEAPGNTAGYYESISKVIKIFKNDGDSETAAHEFLHHTERFLPDDVRSGIYKEWHDEVVYQKDIFLKKLLKEKDPAKKENINKAIDFLNKAEESQSYGRSSNRGIELTEDNISKLGNGISHDFYPLINPSEWWASNGAKFLLDESRNASPNSWVSKAIKWYRDFVSSVKKTLGITNQTAVERGIEAIRTGRTHEDLTGSMLNDSQKFRNIKKGSGNSLDDLITLGKLYIQKGIIKFSDFVTKLREDYKDATGKDLVLTDKEIASQVFKPAMRSMTDPTVDDEDIQERGFGKRMDGSVPDPTQNYIDTDPDHDYERQRLDVLKAELENKTEAELVAHMKPLEVVSALSSQDNVAILAAGELLKRALASDNDLEYQRIFSILDKSGTTLGQLVRQYGEIKGSDPKFLINAFEKKLALGGRFMTDEQKQRLSDAIEDYAKKSITAKDLMLRYQDSLDPKDYRAWVIAKKDAALAFIKFSKIQSDYDMRGFWQTAGSIMKGNLLTPISILKNPLYNLFVNPLMIVGHIAAANIDLIASQVFGLERTTTYSLNQVRAELAGFASGLQTSLRVVRHGVYPGEETKLDSYRGLKPLDAMMQVFTGKDIPKSKNPVQYYKDRFGTKLLEGIFGAPAEANYRLLAIGDRPFYESAYNARLVELAELKGLKGDDYKRFMINPDGKSLEEAKIAGNKATFQHDNMLSKMITTGVGNAVSGLYKSKFAVGGFVADAIAPFVRTPTNVVYSYFKWLMPELHPIVLGMDAYTMADIRGETAASLRNAKSNGASQKALDKIAAEGSLKMNSARREFIGHIGNFMVAIALRSAASWVVSKAVYSGILDPDKKKLGLQYEDSKPNSINVDALKRGIQTGNYSWNANDTYVPLDAFGMFGAAISVQDNINKLEQKDGITLGSEKFPNNMLDNVSYGLPSVVQYAFDQSFLKGTNTMLQALSTGDYSQVAPNIAASMSATVVPNTWSSVARANRELLLNKRPDAASSIIDGKTWEAIKDAIAERTEIHPDLPVKLGMFGTPVRQTPAGRNPYVYQLLDITKFGPVSDDPVVRNIAELYKTTGNDEFIPLPPNQNYMIFGDKRILTGEETLKRQEFVGESRYNAYRTVMQTPGYQLADPNIKAIILGNQVLPAATHEGELMFEAYYVKQHPEIGKDIIKVKTGQEPNNGLNKQE